MKGMLQLYGLAVCILRLLLAFSCRDFGMLGFPMTSCRIPCCSRCNQTTFYPRKAHPGFLFWSTCTEINHHSLATDSLMNLVRVISLPLADSMLGFCAICLLYRLIANGRTRIYNSAALSCYLVLEFRQVLSCLVWVLGGN